MRRIQSALGESSGATENSSSLPPPPDYATVIIEMNRAAQEQQSSSTTNNNINNNINNNSATSNIITQTSASSEDERCAVNNTQNSHSRTDSGNGLSTLTAAEVVQILRSSMRRSVRRNLQQIREGVTGQTTNSESEETLVEGAAPIHVDSIILENLQDSENSTQNENSEQNTDSRREESSTISDEKVTLDVDKSSSVI